MMHWRKGSGGLGRVFSAYVALVLAIAVVSPGIAVYADETTAPEVPIKGDVVTPVEPVPEAPLVEVPQVTDPVPEEVAGEVPVVQEAPAAPAVQIAPKAAVIAEKPAPMALPSTPSILSVYPYAPVGSVSLDGWTRSPHAKWTGGDVKGYFEGEWIPFRLSINNTGGNAVTVQVPSMVYKVDHINSGAIAIDATSGWRWQIDAGAVTSYAPTVQDDDGDPMYLETQLPEVAGFVLQPGETGYIYFEGHLALTSFWSTQDPSYLGASGYPGSSAQARLVLWNGEGIGDKTVPFPVGRETAPNGVLNGLKFEDLNGNGTREAGEGPLAGWVFHLAYQDPDYGFSLTTTSAADGTFSFTSLPPGSYLLTEDQQSPYVLTTNLSQAITVAIGATVGPIEVGNRRPNVTKTFELTVTDEVPEADSYFVRYVIGAVSADL
ncbi:MAG: SdrD B-like domain-containing protein, partial [Coriobacteriia bacterium]